MPTMMASDGDDQPVAQLAQVLEQRHRAVRRRGRRLEPLQAEADRPALDGQGHGGARSQERSGGRCGDSLGAGCRTVLVGGGWLVGGGRRGLQRSAPAELAFSASRRCREMPLVSSLNSLIARPVLLPRPASRAPPKSSSTIARMISSSVDAEAEDEPVESCVPLFASPVRRSLSSYVADRDRCRPATVRSLVLGPARSSAARGPGPGSSRSTSWPARSREHLPPRSSRRPPCGPATRA